MRKLAKKITTRMAALEKKLKQPLSRNAKAMSPLAGQPRWQLQDAKAKFSEVVERALAEGPQVVTRHGKDAVVIVPAATYRPEPKTRKPTLIEVLLQAPHVPEFKIERSGSKGREIPDFS